MAGFKKGELNKVIKAMLKAVDNKSGVVKNYGLSEMRKDVKGREAVDTGGLLDALDVTYEKKRDSRAFLFKIKTLYYTSKNPTTPSYTPDQAPSSPPPGYPSSPLGTTREAAIKVIWGLGPHARRGPRNFPRVARQNTVKKFFGDPKNLKNK